jgi:hypothetical protein
MYGTTSLPFTLSADGKSVTIKGLKAAGATAIAGSHDLQFKFKSGVTLDVVTAKVETVIR